MHLQHGQRDGPVEGDELDRLGAIGEGYFNALCLKAKLKCSTVFPDKTGKDFVVETSLQPATPERSLDKRPAPTQIIAQVKTILAKNSTVRISMSVAERLTKDTRPAIICVFRIGADDTIKSMAIIHLLDDQLASILKRMRRASTRGRVQPHKNSISIKVPNASWVEASKTELARTLMALPGAGMADYAKEKIRQLDELGFDQARFTMHFSVTTRSEDDLVEKFLGLSPLSADNVNLFENRFSIPLPVEDASGPGTLHFEPHHSLHGTLELKSTVTGTTVKTIASIAMIGPPILSEDNIRVSVQTPLGRFILGGGGWTYKCPDDFSLADHHTAKTWVDYLLFNGILARGRFRVTLFADDREPLAMEVDEPRRAFDKFDQYADLAGLVRKILSHADLEDVGFPIARARDESRQLSYLARVLETADGMFSVADDSEPPIELKSEKTAYVSALDLMGTWVGVFFPMTVNAEDVDGVRSLVGKQSSKAIIEKLNDAKLEASFERFREKYSSISGVTSIFVQAPGEFWSSKVAILID